MQLSPFRIERFYARHEFTTRYMLSSSDCQSRTIGELLELEPDASFDQIRAAWRKLAKECETWRVRFEINLAAIQSANLSIRSELLRLASRVIGANHP